MYTPAKERYETMEYNRCGESGLMLPKYLLDYGIISEILLIMKI